MLEKIKIAFYKIGWTDVANELTQSKLDDRGIEDAELIAIRLYTGPCFMLYNTVRARTPTLACLGSKMLRIFVTGSFLIKLTTASPCHRPPHEERKSTEESNRAVPHLRAVWHRYATRM
eukprot:SAG11_NODE_716_length_7614_cov_63.924837_6_plen_119_part_00